MTELDYVLKDIKVVEKNTELNFKEFYQFLKKLLAEHGYFVSEKEYIHNLKEDISNKSIKIKSFKKRDLYYKFNIDLRLKLLNAHEIEDKTNMIYKGDVTLLFECYVERDYYGRWEGFPLKKFLRTIMDKFFAGNLYTKYENEIREETYDVINKVKSYLGG